MSDETTLEAVLDRMRSTSGPPPRLALDAATPLTTLPPEIVALIVGRVEVGASAFGSDHPRRFIVKRVVIPSLVLAVLDAVGLIVAATGGHTVPAMVAAVLLVVLGWFAVAGVRFVRQDPLRVAAAQRAYVEQAKRWRTSETWPSEGQSGPWARLVATAVDAVERISANVAWTWASVAPFRARIELGDVLTAVDADACQRSSDPVPDATVPDAVVPGAADGVVGTVVALQSLADELDGLVVRERDDATVRDVLPGADEQRLTTLIDATREPR